MKDVYAVLRQKEIDRSRLENEVEAVAAPLLDGGDAQHDNQPTLRRAINDPPQSDHSGRQASGKNRWP